MFFVYLFFVAVAIITEIISISDENNRGVQSSDYSDMMSGWTTEDGLNAVLTGINGTYSIKHTLPKINEETILYLNLKSLNLEAFVDGRCVYKSEQYAEHFFGQTPGSFFAEIPLRTTDSGKEIILKATNPYNDDSGKITMAYIGNSRDIIKNEIGTILPGFIVCVLITFLGLIFALAFIPMWMHRAVGTELLYFALFAFNIGVFMLTDCKFFQLIYPDAHFCHMVAETHMMLIAVPLFLFLNKMYSSCNDIMVYCMSIMCSFNFIICYVLNISENMDYHESVWITHTTYVVGIIFLIIVLAKELIRNAKATMYHNIGIFSICAAALLDIVMLKTGKSFETTFFTRIGVLVFICLEGIQIFLRFFKQYREAMKTKLVSRLAYHDGLTELLNRTSFTEDIQKLSKNESVKAVIAMYDVNNLKQINDNYGHAAGDKMIITVAKEMEKILGPLGKCYRIGGDEFVFISDESCTEETFSEASAALMKNLAETETSAFFAPITVAMGYSVAAGADRSLDEVISDADSKMYSNKKQMKLAACTA